MLTCAPVIGPSESNTEAEAVVATLSGAERKLFTENNFVVLATTRRDGTPRAIVLWVDVDGDDILLNGARSRAWIKNLRRDPTVALAIFDLHEPYRRVYVQGTVIAIGDEGADEHYAALTRRYRGAAAVEARARTPRPAGAEPVHRTIVRIRPESISSRVA